MPRKGYSYDLPLFRIQSEYWCIPCNKKVSCFEKERTTCGSCGSTNIITGPPGTFIHLEEVVK